MSDAWAPADGPCSELTGVVVGVDGSQAAQRAVFWAAAQARLRDLPLLILHAAPYAAGGDAAPGRQRAQEVLAAALAAVRRREQGAWISVRGSLEPPVPALRHAAEHAQMLVLGGADRPLAEPTESVGLRVVEDAACPVVVVRGRGRIAADDRPVVVGVDTPDVDALVVAVAIAEAERHRCALVVVHSGRDGIDPTTFVAEIAARHPLLTVRLEQTKTHPTTALLDAARRARMLVIGGRGRSAPVRVRLGSTCRDLIRRSPVPVEIVCGPRQASASVMPGLGPAAGGPFGRNGQPSGQAP